MNDLKEAKSEKKAASVTSAVAFEELKADMRAIIDRLDAISKELPVETPGFHEIAVSHTRQEQALMVFTEGSNRALGKA